MTPIEQVRPALPGNTVRRPDVRNKRNVDERDRDRDQAAGKRPRPGSGSDPKSGDSTHILDEFA